MTSSIRKSERSTNCPKYKQEIQTQINFLLSPASLQSICRQMEIKPSDSPKKNDKLSYIHNLYIKEKCNDLLIFRENYNNKLLDLRKKQNSLNNDITYADNQIKWVTKEKIEAILQKEESDAKLEEIKVGSSRQGGSNCLTTSRNTSNSRSEDSSNPRLKERKLKQLKLQHMNLQKRISEKKKEFEKMREKSKKLKNEIVNLLSMKNQKLLIYNQLVDECERIKKDLSKGKKIVSSTSTDTQSTWCTSKKEGSVMGFLKKVFK